MLDLPSPDGVLSAAEIKAVAANMIGQLPLRGIGGSPLDSGDIWPVVTLASVNQLVYANCVSAIRVTAPDPTISYLHEPGERRYSLSLDLADLFKSVLADRVLFRLVNRNQISDNDFETELGSCLLNESGRKTYMKEFEEMLEQTVEHTELNRKVSYQ